MKRDQEFYEAKRRRALTMILFLARGESTKDVGVRFGITGARVSQLAHWGSRWAAHVLSKEGIVSAINPEWWSIEQIRKDPEFWELVARHFGVEI